MKVASALTFVASLSVIALAFDCGGRAALTPDYLVPGGSAGLGAGGSAHAGNSAMGGSAHAGNSAMGGSAHAGNAAVGGHGGASGGAGGAFTACSAPQDPGPCEAAFTKYWHDPNTGACIPFIYGGCAGNDNRFDTLAACQAACNAVPDAIDACKFNTDCVLEPSCGCVSCNPTLLDYVAINRGAANSNRYERPECAGASCAPCPFTGQDDSLYIVPKCSKGHCAPVDLRPLGAAKCTNSAECQLRIGNECCEACSGYQLLAVNNHGVLESTICEAENSQCPPCLPVYPAGYSATCTNQQCAVVSPPVR